MAPPRITPRNEERDFAFSELFFSTTDRKGVIRYGNEVFSRIAGYPLAEMVGKPHNIIRHPDMPRCAFRLVWDYLEQGRTVCAYVKNLARDGCYYWVMALIMPCDDGYLSIRLKPSSEIFPIVQGAYKAVLAAEKEAEQAGRPRKEAMDAGTTKLVGLLGSLGFKSYDQFMWAALAAEIGQREARRNDGAAPTHHAPPDTRTTVDRQSRAMIEAAHAHCVRLDRQLGNLFAKLGTFSKLAEELTPKSAFILRLGESIRHLSINAEVQSARLGDSGAALSVVAERMRQHTHESAETIEELNRRLLDIASPISELVFNAIVSKLKIEMTAYFLSEILERTVAAEGHDAHDAEPLEAALHTNVRLLVSTFLDTARGLETGFNDLHARLERITAQVDELRRFINTLQFIHFAGKVETARSEAAQAFTTIFDQMHTHINEAGAGLSDFVDLLGANATQITSLDKLDPHAFGDLEKLTATLR